MQARVHRCLWRQVVVDLPPQGVGHWRERSAHQRGRQLQLFRYGLLRSCPPPQTRDTVQQRHRCSDELRMRTSATQPKVHAKQS